MELHADYLALEPAELVEHLLHETGQAGDGPTNPTSLLEYLKLQFVMIDLASIIPSKKKKKPRGVLSFSDRIVGVDSSLRSKVHRARFTTMHEIGHYVLPKHHNDLYVCDDQDMSHDAMIETEMEANAFAADLLFKGDRFTRKVNDCPITPESIKTLAALCDTSFESTARRFVERNARPCCLCVFGQMPGSSVIDTSSPGRWRQSYTISSAEFRTRYFQRLRGDVPPDVGKRLANPGRDLTDSVDTETRIPMATGQEQRFHVSYFRNHYNVFGLFQPAPNKGS